MLSHAPKNDVRTLNKQLTFPCFLELISETSVTPGANELNLGYSWSK